MLTFSRKRFSHKIRERTFMSWKSLKEAPAISEPILSKLYIITSKFARARPHRCFGMSSYILTVNSIPSSCKSLFRHALRWKRANKTRKDFLGFILIDFFLSWPGMFKLTWFKDFSQLASLPHFYWFLITFDLTRMFDLRGGHFLTVH